MAESKSNNRFIVRHKRRKIMRSLSVPRTKHEIKHYRIAGFKLQRSRVNQNRLRRRDIMTASPNALPESSSSNRKSSIHSNSSGKKNKTKLIRKLQKCSEQIQDKFRKKYHTNSRHKNKTTPKKDDGENENHTIQLTVADVCFDFQNHGQCKRGEYCRYQHVPASKSLCLDWKNGHCPRGDVCRFAHCYRTDIVQPKRYNQKNNSSNAVHTKNTNLAPMPPLVQNNILIKGVAPWIHRGPFVIPTRNAVMQRALPKIIQTRNGLNMNNTFRHNMTPTRTPIPVIVRDTNKRNSNLHRMIRRNHAHPRNHYSLTHPGFNRNRSNMQQLREPKKSASLSPSPLVPIASVSNAYDYHTTYSHHAAHLNRSSPAIEYTHSPLHPNEEVEEFDFEKLGDQIQSNIPRNKINHGNMRSVRHMPPPPNQRRPYKLAPHPPPPPPPHAPRGHSYNAFQYPPYNRYKYKCDARASSAAYLYPQESSNHNNYNINNNM